MMERKCVRIGTMDFPGDTVNKNLSANARDTDLIPSWGILLMLWNLCAMTTEPMHLEPGLHKRSHHNVLQ